MCDDSEARGREVKDLPAFGGDHLTPEAGLVWHYITYDASSGYARAERDVGEEGRGLWASLNPVPPWG